jgi:hypothetical protein
MVEYKKMDQLCFTEQSSVGMRTLHFCLYNTGMAPQPPPSLYFPPPPPLSLPPFLLTIYFSSKLNVVRKDGATPLVLAAKYGRLEAVKTLLKEGVKVILLSISSLSFLSSIYIFYIRWHLLVLGHTHSMSQQNTDA